MPAREPVPSSRNRQGAHPQSAPSRRFQALSAACAAALLALSGCDDDPAAFADDETPPDLIIQAPASQGKYRFGVTDTVAIDFSEPIDTAALEVSIADSVPVGHIFRGRDRLLLFGTEESHGSRHFKINTSFTLSLIGLRDDAGNGLQDVVEEEFRPYRWADRDVIDRSFRGYDSLFSGDSAWVDGSPLKDTLIVEGALDFNETTGDEDRVDIKIVRLSAPDTLEITVTSRPDAPINLQLGGPFKPDELDSALSLAQNFPKPGKLSDRTGRLDTALRADYGVHDVKLGSSAAPGLYALRLSLPTADTEGFYRIRLKLKKLRK